MEKITLKQAYDDSERVLGKYSSVEEAVKTIGESNECRDALLARGYYIKGYGSCRYYIE